MSQLLEDLFSVLEPTRQTEAEHQAMQAVDRIVQNRLTDTEIDQLWASIRVIDEADRLECFRRGLCLGIQLMLEGMRPLQLDN